MGKNARLKKERKNRFAPSEERNSIQLAETATTSEAAISEPHLSSTIYRFLTHPVLHIILIFGLCFATGIYPIESEDIFANIVTGEYLWKTKSIPTDDPFSFTGPHKWALNGPLPSLIFYGVHSLGAHSIGGLEAIQIFCILVFSVTYSILYFGWSKRTDLPLLAFTVTSLAILGSCYWFQTRMYVFAYMFLATAILLITSSNRRAILWMLPIQVLWINSHPSAILGVFLVGAWWMRDSMEARRFNRFPTCVLLGVVVANMVCPGGIRSYLKFAEELFASHPSRANIFEWFSPFHPTITSQHLAWWFFASLVVFATTLGINFLYASKVRSAFPIIPVAIALCLLSCSSARHIPLFYMSFLALLVCTGEWIWKNSKWQLVSLLKRHRTAIAIAIIAFAIFSGIKVVLFGYPNGDTDRRFALGIDKRKFPEIPTKMLLDAKIGGNIFSDYGSGSYFLYRMYPHYKVYIDSARLDEVYGEEGFLYYMKVGNDEQIIKRDIERYDLRSFILPLPASESDIVPIYKFLSAAPDWRLAFFDDGYMVFILATEAERLGIPTYSRLNPFLEQDKLMKQDPTLAAMLERDYELGTRINPDSMAFMTMKAFFLKRQGRTHELQATLDQMAALCPRKDPSRGCKRMAARQLIRFGRYSQARELAPEELS
jgi:hypothetical protein